MPQGISRDKYKSEYLAQLEQSLLHGHKLLDDLIQLASAQSGSKSRLNGSAAVLNNFDYSSIILNSLVYHGNMLVSTKSIQVDKNLDEVISLNKHKDYILATDKCDKNVLIHFL